EKNADADANVDGNGTDEMESEGSEDI
ncbi:hypothetical protein A2U01_0083854, partial [Trifolium medium]|nr:hypothetical protein [Trifolium medium]